MRFTSNTASVFVLTLVALTTTVSAQLPTTGACSLCIINACLDASPDCNDETLATDNPPNNMTLKEKSCWCALASCDAYLRTCIKPDGCTEADAKRAFSGVAVIKDEVCVGVTPLTPSVTGPGPVSATSGTLSPSTPTALSKSGAGSVVGSGSFKVVAGAISAVTLAATLVL